MRTSHEDLAGTPVDRLLARVIRIMSATGYSHANASPGIVCTGFYTTVTKAGTIQVLWLERLSLDMLGRAMRQAEFLRVARGALELQFSTTRVHRITEKILDLRREGFEIELGK